MMELINIRPDQNEAVDKEPLNLFEDLKWFQRLLGVTKKLRISAAASQLMSAYVIAFTDQSPKVPPL